MLIVTDNIVLLTCETNGEIIEDMVILSFPVGPVNWNQAHSVISAIQYCWFSQSQMWPNQTTCKYKLFFIQNIAYVKTKL